MRLHLDYETYSEVPISVGTYAYAMHPTTQVLMLGWSVDDGPVHIWDAYRRSMPNDLYCALEECDEVWAYNATFERCLTRFAVGVNVPLRKWRCTQVLAYSLGFAGKMDEVLTRFNLDNNKSPDGQRLIQKFSKPQGRNRKVRRWLPDDAPEDYLKFQAYCRQDVNVERHLMHRCKKAGAGVDWTDYAIDQTINDRGLPIDMTLVDRSLEYADRTFAMLFEEAQTLTGLDNPNSAAQITEFCSRYGVEMPNMQAATVERMLRRNDLPGVVRRLLFIRQQMAKGSVSKWKALKASTLPTRRLHGAFQFLGAGRTGRWAGRVFQPQNLPRPTISDPVDAADVVVEYGAEFASALYGPPMQVLSSTLRSAISSGNRRSLVVADLSGIEGVVAGWLTDCNWINTCYRENRDMYKELASQIHQVSPAAVDKAMRNYHKPIALGGQYQLGDRGLVKYAASMGVTLDPKDSIQQVQVYRGLCPEVVNSWGQLSEAAMAVTRAGGTARVLGGRVTYHRADEFLRCVLPSGRAIYYYRPKVMKVRMPWTDDEGEPVYRWGFTYMGKNQHTQKWERLAVHGGSLLENITQAVARDVLMHGLRGAEDEERMDVLGHVHDEIVADAYTDVAPQMLNLLIECMTTVPVWGEGLMLKAEGYISHRFRKD